MESNFNLLYIIDIIRKYFRYIAIVVVISVILAIILTMPAIYAPQYASQTIVYPMNPERYDMINAISEKDKELYVYGGPKDVEKLAN
jgi:capsular polysaccharide biosynthesis protein